MTNQEIAEEIGKVIGMIYPEGKCKWDCSNCQNPDANCPRLVLIAIRNQLVK